MEGEERHVNMKPQNADNPKKKSKNSILDIFQNLSKGNEATVVKSSLIILKHLLENEENELEYTLNRLIRGLGGTNPKIQANFFSLLVVLLNTHKDITVNELFQLIDKTLQSSASNSKGENADIFTGRILACGAVIHSTIFDQIAADDQKKVLEILHDSGKKRSYLLLQANVFLGEVAQKMKEVDFKQLLLPIIKDEILKPLEQQTMDALYLLLICVDKFPSIFNKKLFKQHLKCSAIVCESNSNVLANLLMNTTSVKSVKHPLYEMLMKKVTETCLTSFLNELDKCLVKPNYNRHLISAHILTLALQNLTDKSSTHLLLTENFMLHTMHYFKTRNSKAKKDELHTYLQNFFKKLVEASSSSDSSTKSTMLVLHKLMYWPGSLMFDQLTKTSVVADITNSLQSDGVQELVQDYKDIVTIKVEKLKEGFGKERWLNSDRLFAANALVRLLRHPSVAEDLTFRQEQICFLMRLSLCKSEHVSVEMATSLKKTFYSALDQKFPKLENLCGVLSGVVHSLDAELKQGNLTHPLEPSAAEMWRKTAEFVEELANDGERSAKKKKKRRKMNEVFRTVFLMIGLQLFQQPKLTEDCLDELFICYERVNAKSALEPDGGPLWIEVIVDLFLNLLSQNSHLLRNMVTAVFPHLCPHLTHGAVRQILFVLDPANEENPLKNYEDDDEDDDEDEGDEEPEQDEREEEPSKDDDEDSLDESGADSDAEETVNDKLRLAIQQTLHKSGLAADEESVDLDQMSESEGKELDAALAAAFRQFKPRTVTGKRSKKQPEEERALTAFRSRVLDLVRTYLNSAPSMTVCVDILETLLRLLEFTVRESHQAALGESVKKTIEALAQLRQFSSVEGVDESLLCELLDSLLGKGTRNANLMRDMDVALSNSCKFVVRCTTYYCALEAVPKSARKALKKRVKHIFAEQLSEFMRKRDSITPYVLWKELIAFEPFLHLAPTILDNAFNPDVKLFKRSQALQLLQVLYENTRLMSSIPEAKVRALAADFREKTVQFLQDLNANTLECAANDKFLAGLFACLALMKKSPKLPADSIDFALIGEQAREVRGKLALSANCTKQFRNLCRALGIEPVVVMQTNLVNLRRAEQGQREENDDGKKVGKREAQKEDGEEKSRKHKKKERLQSLSKGFSGHFVFEGLDANGDMDGDQDDENDKQTAETAPAGGKRKLNGEDKKAKKKKKKSKHE